MTTLRADVAVIGSGFAGSLFALIARRIGLDVVLIERGRHPRFALGESTTPLSNLILAGLARRYRLPRLFERVHYGPWKRARPDLPVGVKRGFTFFRHKEGEAMETGAAGRLLVEASDRDEVADVQWLRASFDEFLVGEAVQAGVTYLDRIEVEVEKAGDPFLLAGWREGERYRVEARLLVDATGEGGFLERAFSIPERAARTEKHRVSALFAHFAGVQRITPVLEKAGHPTRLFPYRCDDAAVHHIFDAGWMWHLRFDNGVTSAGFLFDGEKTADDPEEGPAAAWNRWTSRFPTLSEIYRDAVPVRPVRYQSRISRFFDRASGGNWVLLPHAAYFVDPLLSGGIPHSLAAVERLARLLEKGMAAPTFSGELERLGREVLEEAEGLEELVRGCYRSFPRFELFTAFVMHYFVAASSLEISRRAGDGEPDQAGFLRMRDPRFRAALAQSRAELERLLAAGPGDAGSFLRRVASRLAPWNRERFCDPSAGNIYRSPVRPEEVWREEIQ